MIALCALGTVALVGCFGAGTIPAGPGDAGYGRPPELGPSCIGNNDGVIDFSELLFPIGAAVNYLVNPAGTTVPVAPDGTAGSGGLQWDLSSTDGDVRPLTLEPPAQAWWGPHFPDASYAVTADLATGTLGVFRVTSGGVLLLGFASAEPDRTLLVYQQPILSLRLPVRQGDAWVTGAKIAGGAFDGRPFASSDTYRISVDASGTAVLPYLRFDHTLRVHVETTQALPAGVALSRIQYLYYHECYGELGRMVSNVGETDPAFATAAEFRRLAL